jgi:hypothetical protein
MAVLLRKHQATTAKDFNQNPNYQIWTSKKII